MNSVAVIFSIILSTLILSLPANAQSQQSIKELPLPEVPATMTQPKERADYVIAHFWDTLNFSDVKSTLNDASLEQNFVNYINLFSHSHSDKLPEKINNLLFNIEKDPTAAKKIYNLADKYLASKDSPFRNEGFYILFLENATRSNAMGEAGRERAKYRLDAALKNRPGNIASDFKFETRDGDHTSLSDIPATSKILLIFYDPDCNHCTETIDELKNLPLESIHVVAIDPEEDKMLWDSTKFGLPQNWVVGYAIDPILEDETYVFEEMPTLYVLDESKKILLKDATILEIKEILCQ